jgi:hypothetical protein
MKYIHLLVVVVVVVVVYQVEQILFIKNKNLI